MTLGQRLVTVLEDGRRTATYKLATMVALLDLAVEHVPDDPTAAVDINLDDLAHRVMDLYWRQLRPLQDVDGDHVLRQTTQPSGKIFTAVTTLRTATITSRSREIPIESAAIHASAIYASSRVTVKRSLVEMPLKRLQQVGTGPYDCFLYDDSWMGRDSLRAINDHGNRLTLFPGICHTLAQLAPLVKPAFQLAWVDDVRRMNKLLLDTGPDLAHHLFGADRISLAKPAEVLAEQFGTQCFYCSSRLPRSRHVDHVLPWSRVGIDGLSNLVLSCAECNGNKSDLLPDPQLVLRALDRGHTVLDDLAASINWPSQYQRVASVAHGIYSTQPESTPMWLGRKQIRPFERTDISWPTVAW
ncbi:HNH endonuclease [Gordonia sp. NPDC003424]